MEDKDQLAVPFRDPVLQAILRFKIDEVSDNFSPADIDLAKEVVKDLYDSYSPENLDWPEDLDDDWSPESGNGFPNFAIEEFIARRPKPAVVTREEMGLLKELDLGSHLDDPYIEDISGLNFATNLKTLSLTANVDLESEIRLKTIEALASLSNLEELDLSQNCLEDIDAIQHMAGLRNLSISSMSVPRGDLTPVGNAKHLEYLYISTEDYSGHHQDLYWEPLSQLKNLRELEIFDFSEDTFYLEDVSFIGGMSKLEEFTFLGTMFWDDEALSPLLQLNNLKRVEIRSSGASRMEKYPFDRVRSELQRRNVEFSFWG